MIFHGCTYPIQRISFYSELARFPLFGLYVALSVVK